ncbi:MAG: hypothetical protein WCD70_00205 [Alphaproteobacteria bacterium]
MAEYKKGDDLATLEALKKEAFKQVFHRNNAEDVRAAYVLAFAELVKAEQALKRPSEPKALDPYTMPGGMGS